MQYLENYPDLQAAFGTDLEAATRHYVTNGVREGRSDTAVDLYFGADTPGQGSELWKVQSNGIFAPVAFCRRRQRRLISRRLHLVSWRTLL